MSDRNDEHDKLLAGTFHDDWASGSAAEFARAAAAHARRRQRTRRALLSGGTGVLLLAMVFLTLRPAPPAPSTLATSAAPVAPLPIAARGYEIISDEELMTQLRDRPLLVMQKQNGAREFVLLANE